MTKVNPNNENETKSDIFARDIFKFGVMHFFMNKYLKISMIFRLKIFPSYDWTELKQ